MSAWVSTPTTTASRSATMDLAIRFSLHSSGRVAPAGREGGRYGDGARWPSSYEVTVRPTGRCPGGSARRSTDPYKDTGSAQKRVRPARQNPPATSSPYRNSDRARDQVFLRVRSTCSAQRPRRGIQAVQRTRHLFSEHCSGENDTCVIYYTRVGRLWRRFFGIARLRIGVSAPYTNGPKENLLVMPPIGINAPFTVR
jgi:hypothetical protein